MNHEAEAPELEPDAFAAANAAFAECQVTADFLNTQVRPIVAAALGPTPARADETWLGLLLRNIAWLRSLGKLNEPGDFQAVAVAARTLFEVAVDVAIMHYDPANPTEKLMAWEESAKLKAAEKIRDHYAGKGIPVPAQYAPQMEFIQREGARVVGVRQRYWSGKKPHHPQRWTARHLDKDAEEATKLAPKAEFDRFYYAEYQGLCWNTHGSGLTGVRNVDANTFPMVSGLALLHCASFSVLVAEVVLRHLGLLDIDRQKLLHDHNTHRILAKYEGYRAALRRRHERPGDAVGTAG